MAKRRPRGTGSIKVLADGQADAQYVAKRWDGTSRRMYKRLPNEEAAERWLLKMRHEEAESALPAEGADGLAVGEYLRSWLRESVSGTVSRHTERDYRDKVELHIAPRLGRVKLRDLTTAHLNRLYRDLHKEDKTRTARYVHSVMRRALHEAEGADLVRKNVAQWAKPPQEEYVEQPVMSVDEAGRFLTAIRGDRLEALYLLAVTTGLRRGELLGLRWTDVDLASPAGTMRVSRSLDTQYGPARDNRPKRSASRRGVALPPSVVAALRARKATHAAEKLAAGKDWEENGYVFPTLRGTPMRGENLLRRGLYPMMEKAGLPRYDFRALRRSNATFLVMLGVNLRVAQRMMGHGSVETTARFYAQVPDELQTRAAGLIGDLFAGENRS